MSAEKKPEPVKADTASASAPPATAATAAATAGEAPDPDEDDLDDLDEVLDEFSPQAKTAAAAAPAPAASSSTAPTAPAANPPAQDDFDKQLQEEMAKLMSDVNDNPEAKASFDEMMKELGSVVEQQLKEGNEPGSSSSAASAAAASAAGKDSFEETIRKTMERMQTSNEKATAEASTSGQDDFLEQMLKQMQGDGNDEDFSKMLLGMMEQLTNKEILYEPMKDLNTKFPGWMEKNKDKTPAADLARFTDQQRLVKEIVARFERPGYSDDNAEDREYIVERMQQMQAAGSPPQDLVGDMEDAQKAFGDIEQNCPQQ